MQGVVPHCEVIQIDRKMKQVSNASNSVARLPNNNTLPRKEPVYLVAESGRAQR